MIGRVTKCRSFSTCQLSGNDRLMMESLIIKSCEEKTLRNCKLGKETSDKPVHSDFKLGSATIGSTISTSLLAVTFTGTNIIVIE